MSDERAIPEALERLFDQAFADGIAVGKSGDESILAGSSGVYAQSALTIVAADRLTDTGEGAAYWQGYDDGKRAALVTPKPPVDAGAMREADLDWRAIGKLAGEHGVRFRTNRALVQFLNAIRDLTDDGGAK